jgi:hypothetical protein
MTPRTLALAIALTAAPLAALSPSASAQGMPAPIETETLRDLDAWSVSALSPGEGALPRDLWSRSDAGVIALLFDRLPAVYASPASQTLARRVLMSGGDAPPGDALEASRNRFEALGKMGAADALAIMAAGSGSALTDPQIAQFAAQAELARGRRPEACARGRSANVGETPPPFLLRLRAYCAAVTGDRAAADLALELARAANASDAWYTGAVAAAGGAPTARPPNARYDNSLAVQLSLAGGLRPASTSLNNASPLALLALARAENAPQPQRAQAATLAFRRGILPVAEARAILLATPADVTRPPAPYITALRAIEAAPGSLEAAAAIAGVLRQATTPSDFYAAALLFKNDIAALQTAPDQAAALLFARAAIVAGDYNVAQRLVASARQAGGTEAALGPLDAALWVRSPSPQSAPFALTRRIDAAGGVNLRGAARDVAIMAAMGGNADGAVQAFLIANPTQGGVGADAGVLLALSGASERTATGEAALLAVIAAGDGAARLDAESLARILRNLRAAGLDADARRFAVEAILAGAPR